jgi:hypothetical protein
VGYRRAQFEQATGPHNELAGGLLETVSGR